MTKKSKHPWPLNLPIAHLDGHLDGGEMNSEELQDEINEGFARSFGRLKSPWVGDVPLGLDFITDPPEQVTPPLRVSFCSCCGSRLIRPTIRFENHYQVYDYWFCWPCNSKRFENWFKDDPNTLFLGTAPIVSQNV